MKKIEITCKCGNTRMLTPTKAKKIKVCAACERRERIEKNNIVITCAHEGCTNTRTIRSQNVHSVRYCIIHQYEHKAKLNNQYVKAWRAKQKLIK